MYVNNLIKHMENIVFVVIGKYGTYDGVYDLCHGVFSTEGQALSAQETIISYHKKVLATCPVDTLPEDRYHLFYHITDDCEREKIRDDFMTWLDEDDNELSDDFRNIDIQSFTLNVISELPDSVTVCPGL